MRAKYDVLVVGGGHNGLVAAGYLARNGLSTLVLERADVVGGACVTRELIPGFRLSTGAQLLGMLRQRIIDDLELERHGLRYHLREPEIFAPFPDRRHVFFYADAERTMQSIARVAPADAEAYPRYEAHTTRIARVLNGFMMRPRPSLPEFAAAFEGPDGAEMLNSVLFTSVGDYLERFFASDYVQGPMAYGGMSGSAASPWTPGTAFSKFYHSATELGGLFGCWAIAYGGMGGITAALAKAVLAAGGEIRLGATVAEIVCRHGRAAGVALDNGDEIQADVVLSNADPKATLLRLVPEAAVPEPARAQLASRRDLGTGAKINFALAELPDFAALPGKALGPQHCGGIMIAPSLDYLDRAWDEAKRGLPSSRPFSQMVIQSATDPSVAPAGRHTLSLWCHHFPYQPAGGEIDRQRERLGEVMTDILTELAPNFRASVIAREVCLPVDIERVYGITGGQIFHGDLMPDRVLWNRPLPGYSGHGDVVPGLYLCGAGTHPGGDVCGAPGYNAARAVLAGLARAQLDAP
jgi:phytoene dehydrogenase-like protein